MYTNYLAWMLIAPFVLSLAAFALRRMGAAGVRWVEWVHLLSITLVLALGLLVIAGVLTQGSVVALHDWLHVDALAAVFLLIVCGVGFLVGLYSLGYIRNDVANGELDALQVSFYYGLFNLFLFTMLLLVTANNIIMMWVAIEATTLGSAFLVGIYGRRSSLEAAWKYVIICTVGVAFGLYGTILVYSDAVNFMREPGAAVLWTEIVKNAHALDPTLLKLAFVFILIGFGTKAGLFPMHAWLPDAHSEAPSPVSALLSGVLLNCALLVVFRFAIILNNGIGPKFTQNIFLVFGALSVMTSALFMFMQKDIKRLLAYSSVENIGLIVLAFGIGGAAGILAGLLQAINHSLVKSLLFCTAGNLQAKYHTRDLGKIRGVLHSAPLTATLLLVGALAIVGLPPFNIFVSKFSIIAAGISSGHTLLMVISLLFMAVIFAAMLRMISGAVFGELPEGVPTGEVRVSMIAPVALLVVFVLALGLFIPPQIGALINQAAGVAMSGQTAAAPSLLAQAVHWLPVGLLQYLNP